MKSSSYASDSLKDVEGKKQSSFSRLFNWFLIISFILQVVIGLIIIVCVIGGELSKMQLVSVENELGSRMETLDRYLGDRLSLLEDYSRMPDIVAGAMNPTANIVDFIDSLSMLKEKAFFCLQNNQGRAIYSSQATTVFARKGEAVQNLANGKKDVLVDVVMLKEKGPDCWYWRLNVPVLYNGLPEGVLSAYIPISFETISTARDTGAVCVSIVCEGQTILSRGQAHEPTFTLRVESAFPGIGLVQVVSNRDVNQRVEYLVTGMIVVLVLGTLVLFGMFRMAGKKFLVVPHARLQALSDELEKEVEKRTEDLKMRTVQLSIEIRERREAEKEARETGQLVSALLEGIGAAFYIINPVTGKIVRSNLVVQTMFGLSPHQLSGKLCYQVFAKFPENVKELLCPDCISNNAYVEGIAHRADGQPCPVSRHLVSVEIGGEECIGVMLLDITERKTLERRLNIAQKLESVGGLASGIAHEINTPIQYVGDSIRFLEEVFGDVAEIMEAESKLAAKCREAGSHAELVERIGKLSEDADLEFVMGEIPKACSRALEGTERVAVIVRAMKNFAHPGEGEKTLVDINQALENTTTVSKNEWKYVAEVTMDFDPIPYVQCFAGDINQVFLNILVNAAHAIEDVVGDSGNQGTITVSTRKYEDIIIVRISDTGAGIPLENRDKIFDPFFTTKEVGRGTGQGLAIVHDVVVERHGGTIDVESTLGQGTTFVIGLPQKG